MLMTHLDHGIALSPSTPQCNPDLDPKMPPTLQPQKLKYASITAKSRHLLSVRDMVIGYVPLKCLLLPPRLLCSKEKYSVFSGPTPRRAWLTLLTSDVVNLANPLTSDPEDQNF